jgi:hypothetical protein
MSRFLVCSGALLDKPGSPGATGDLRDCITGVAITIGSFPWNETTAMDSLRKTNSLFHLWHLWTNCSLGRKAGDNMLATNLRVIYRMPQVPFPWIDFAGWETRRGWFALASKGSLKGECRFQASPQCAWADNVVRFAVHRQNNKQIPLQFQKWLCVQWMRHEGYACCKSTATEAVMVQWSSSLKRRG